MNKTNLFTGLIFLFISMSANASDSIYGVYNSNPDTTKCSAAVSPIGDDLIMFSTIGFCDSGYLTITFYKDGEIYKSFDGPKSTYTDYTLRLFNGQLVLEKKGITPWILPKLN
jgi:hypothetical protein